MMARYVDLGDEPIAGNPGAPLDPEAEARAAALSMLEEPIDVAPPTREGEAAQAIGDAARAQGMPETWAGRDATAGLGPADVVAPRDGGSATMPSAPVAPRLRLDGGSLSLYDPRRDHASAVVARTTPDTTPAAPMAPSAPAPAAAPTMTQAATKTGGPSSGESSLDRELRAAQEARARRMIGNAFGSLVEIGGALATGVPIQPGTPVSAGPAEDEARILREHRLAAAEKDREGRESSLASARAEREAMLEDREFGLRERALGVQEQRANRVEQPSDLDAARAEQIRESIARHEREMSPDSPESAAARGEFMAVVDTLPPSMRARALEAFGPRVETMSAAELRAPIARFTRYVERGTSGHAGGPPSPARAERRASLEAAAREAGINPAAASTMTDQQLASEINMRGRQTARMQSEGEEILPGVRAGIALDRGEGGRIRTGFASTRAGLANLRAIEDLAQRYGASAAFSPEALAEVRSRMTNLMSMVAAAGHLGVIAPGEVPRIQGSLPDPTSIQQIGIGGFAAHLRSWRSMFDDAVASELVARGVDDEGVRNALAMLHGGGARPQQTAARAPAAESGGVERVRMRRPDGSISLVRADQVERARASRGYEVVE